MRLAMLLLMAVALPVAAQAPRKADKDAAHLREDVAAHRTLAAAHEAAAKCLESGRPEKECHAQLARDCKGVGIGKYCGMRHRH